MKKNVELMSLKECVSEKIGFTSDIMLGATIVTIEGDKLLYIENYKGIISYSDKMILVLGKKHKIQIEGKNLQIEYYTNMDMKIQGNISCVKYC